jgi:hypothetical protein
MTYKWANFFDFEEIKDDDVFWDYLFLSDEMNQTDVFAGAGDAEFLSSRVLKNPG